MTVFYHFDPISNDFNQLSEMSLIEKITYRTSSTLNGQNDTVQRNFIGMGIYTKDLFCFKINYAGYFLTISLCKLSTSLSLSLSRSKKRVIISAFISHKQKRDNRAYYEIMNLFAIISNRMPERIVCSRLSLSQLPFLCIPFFGVFLCIFINIMISQN